MMTEENDVATTIHTATMDGATLSLHRTAEGAARAIGTEISRRHERFRGEPLPAAEVDLLSAAVLAHRDLNLNSGGGIGGQVEGMDDARVHQIAFAINILFAIAETPLLD